MDISQLWNLDWVRAVQSLGPWLITPMVLFSFLGQQFLFLVVPLLFWCMNKRLGRDLAILLVLSSVVNYAIKSLFKEPRPYWLDPALGGTGASGFSFPSGHAQASALVFGGLAYLVMRTGWPALRRVAVAILLGVLVVMVMLSRVYLGAHYPGDTLAGMTVGLIVLALFIRLRPVVGPVLARLPATTHILLALLSALFVLGLGVAGLAIRIPEPAAAAELVAAGHTATLTEGAMFAGLLAGFWLGLVWEERRLRFEIAGLAWQRALRYVLGGMAAAALYFAMHALVNLAPAPLALPLDVLQFTVVGLWVTALWPWLFVRAGLTRTPAS